MIADLDDLHLRFSPPSEDKWGHAIAGYCIGMGAIGATELVMPQAPRPVKVLLQLAAPIAAGVAKELYDRHHHGDADWRDVAATAAGGAFAIALAWRF